jgi:hypothetical protein
MLYQGCIVNNAWFYISARYIIFLPLQLIIIKENYLPQSVIKTCGGRGIIGGKLVARWWQNQTF